MRTSGWSEMKFGQFARTWLYFSEDATTGVEQTVALLRDTLFEKFKSFRKSTREKTYSARSKHSVCAKFDEVSTNVQNFCYALCIVHS